MENCGQQVRVHSIVGHDALCVLFFSLICEHVPHSDNFILDVVIIVDCPGV